jgi:recombination protein RecR
VSNTHALQGLLDALRRLPGVGARSGQRMAHHLLQHDREGALRLAQALTHAVQSVRHCER